MQSERASVGQGTKCHQKIAKHHPFAPKQSKAALSRRDTRTSICSLHKRLPATATLDTIGPTRTPPLQQGTTRKTGELFRFKKGPCQYVCMRTRPHWPGTYIEQAAGSRGRTKKTTTTNGENGFVLPRLRPKKTAGGEVNTTTTTTHNNHQAFISKQNSPRPK